MRLSVCQLLWSDYVANCERADGTLPPRWTLPLRFIVNPSLHACTLIRLANASPRWLFFLWRNLLIAKHSIDLHPHCHIGPGLTLPHPLNICIAGEVRVGADCVLLHGCNVGSRQTTRPGAVQVVPTIGDRVTLYTGCLVVGGIHVGSDVVVGAYAFVDADVPDGGVIGTHSLWRGDRSRAL